MSGFKFIHAADLHLDSPLVGLARYPGAPADDIHPPRNDEPR
jgi:DNA repair protein SbcD/Mre11